MTREELISLDACTITLETLQEIKKSDFYIGCTVKQIYRHPRYEHLEIKIYAVGIDNVDVYMINKI